MLGSAAADYVSKRQINIEDSRLAHACDTDKHMHVTPADNIFKLLYF